MMPVVLLDRFAGGSHLRASAASLVLGDIFT